MGEGGSRIAQPSMIHLLPHTMKSGRVWGGEGGNSLEGDDGEKGRWEIRTGQGRTGGWATGIIII